MWHGVSNGLEHDAQNPTSKYQLPVSELEGIYGK
jgi:hypothetical protein